MSERGASEEPRRLPRAEFPVRSARDSCARAPILRRRSRERRLLPPLSSREDLLWSLLNPYSLFLLSSVVTFAAHCRSIRASTTSVSTAGFLQVRRYRQSEKVVGGWEGVYGTHFSLRWIQTSLAARLDLVSGAWPVLPRTHQTELARPRPQLRDADALQEHAYPRKK